MEFKNLFEKEAFKNINQDILKDFENLLEKIKNKDINQSIIHIMEFYNKNCQKEKLTPNQTQALIDTIVQTLNKEERDKFLNMLNIVNNFI